MCLISTSIFMIEFILDAYNILEIDYFDCNNTKLQIMWIFESEFEHSDLMQFEVSRQKKFILIILIDQSIQIRKQ